MKTYNIFTNKEDSLPKGKADFLLAVSVSKSSEEDVLLTPTLDAEFIITQKVFSHGELAQTPNGVPTLALVTRAVHNLHPFSAMEILDLGLEIKPQRIFINDFNVSKRANIDAKEIFRKGMNFGHAYELKGAYLILAESVLGGETTAGASVLALGYDCADAFSSSCVEIDKALALTNANMSRFEKLSLVSDNMLLFCAGFLLEATRRFHVVLAGGAQMAACLLIADALKEDALMRLKHDNVTLATTAWVAHDANLDITRLLSLLSYSPHAIYTDFSFEDTEMEILKRYEEGEQKDGVGAGGALAYASSNNLTNQEVLEAMELIMYAM